MKPFKQFYEENSFLLEDTFRRPIHLSLVRDESIFNSLDPADRFVHQLYRADNRSIDVVKPSEEYTGIHAFRQEHEEEYNQLITLMDARQYQLAGDLYQSLAPAGMKGGDLVLYYYLYHGLYRWMDIPFANPEAMEKRQNNRLFESAILRWDPEEKKGSSSREWLALQQEAAAELLTIETEENEAMASALGIPRWK